MVNLKIDPEFRDKIPALTDAEFDQLKENILADGEVYEPIVTWNDTIIDGHNRWKIICENWEKLKDKFRTKPMEFADKWEAFEWMYRKQLGRRNLSDEQKKYMIGKMYEARKQSAGNKTSARNADGTFQSGQNVHNGESLSKREVKDGTAGEIGKEIGVDGRTVRRAEKFAKGVDAIREEFPETADRILKGGSGITKEFVASIPAMPDEQKIEAIEAVKSGPEAVAKFKKNATMEECNATPIVHTSEYDAEDFKDQVGGFSAEFDSLVRIFLMSHEELLNNPICADAFDKMLADTEQVIKKYREVLNEHRN